MARYTLRQWVDQIVIVNTIAGRERSFRGRLVSVDADELVLVEVALLEPQAADLGGRVVFPRNNIAWVQVM